MKNVGSFTEDNMAYKGKPMSEMSGEDRSELKMKLDNRKTRKRNPILEEILDRLNNEPWYDKVRRNLNTMLYYKIWLNPFSGVFRKK